jgi:hypothetical protein
MAGVVEARSVSTADYGDILNRMLQAINAVNNPSWLDKTVGAIRATITALPTLAAVTTVSTVTTLANLGSWAGDPIVRLQTTQAWALAARARIT